MKDPKTIEQTVAAALQGQGVELVDLVIQNQGRKKLLQFFVDKDGGVTDIRQGGNRSINTDALSEIIAPNVYLHLIEVGDIQNVNMVKNAEGSGTCVMLINTTPSQLIFDVDGNFIITAG